MMRLSDVMSLAGVVGLHASGNAVPARRFMKLSDGDLEPFDPKYQSEARDRRVKVRKVRMVKLESSGELVPLFWLRNEALKLIAAGVCELHTVADHLGCSYPQVYTAFRALRLSDLIEREPGLVSGYKARMRYRLTRLGREQLEGEMA